MKTIQYEILGYTGGWNPETGEDERKECVSFVTAVCKTQAEFDEVYPVVEKAAVPGSINVTGEFEPEEVTADDVLNTMLGVM